MDLPRPRELPWQTPLPESTRAVYLQPVKEEEQDILVLTTRKDSAPAFAASATSPAATPM